MAAIIANKIDKCFFFQHQRTLKELVQAIFFRQKTLEMMQALKNVTFQINQGETVGLIGKNGAGKSTLLKILAGVSQPTAGTVKVNGRVVPLIELGAGFHYELTGSENIYLNGAILGLKESYIRQKYQEIVAFAELQNFMDIPLKYYSSGMQMRLAFSVAIFMQPEILLIDEILAVGDLSFQEKCLKKMFEFKKQGVTIIFVSHSMEAVAEFCDRVIYLKKGEVVYDGQVNQGIDIYKQELTV